MKDKIIQTGFLEVVKEKEEICTVPGHLINKDGVCISCYQAKCAPQPSGEEKCCGECATPASGAPDETVKECSNPKCNYCHVVSPTVTEEWRAKMMETAERIVIDYADCSGRQTANRSAFRGMVIGHLLPLLSSRFQDGRQEGAEQERERCIKIIKEMRPILWDNDPEKHKRNITEYETLDDVISKLTSN